MIFFRVPVADERQREGLGSEVFVSAGDCPADGSNLSVGKEGEISRDGSRAGVAGEAGKVIRFEVSSDGSRTFDDSKPSPSEGNSGDSGYKSLDVRASRSEMRGVLRKSLQGVSPGESSNWSKDGVHGEVRYSLSSNGDRSEFAGAL